MESLKNRLSSPTLFAKSGKVKKILVNNGSKILIIFFGCYIVASTFGVILVSLLTKGVERSSLKVRTSASVSMPKRPFINYRNLQIQVVSRNIFNSSGEVPNEAEQEKVQSDQKPSDFNENAPCKQSTLELTLVGTIYQKTKEFSIATIQEKGLNQADIYRVGDQIIGNDNAVLYAIFHQKVVINNNGVKECLEVEKGKLTDRVTISIEPEIALEDEDNGPENNAKKESNSSHFVLTNEYVEKTLGPGFSKILATGRLVPYNNGQRMQGFRLVGVRTESIWHKISLNNGDVLVKVNKTDMTMPDQGFGFYQALSEEQYIRVEYLKNGEIPSTLTIEIK